jgi:hypothetical protein
MTSLRLASDNLLVCTSSFCLWLRRGPHTKVGMRRPGPTRMWRHLEAWAPSQRRVGCQFPTPGKYASWQHARAADSDKSCNVAQFHRAAPDASSRPTLRHANPIRGTRVPPIISVGLMWRAHPVLKRVESTQKSSEEAPGARNEQRHLAMRRPWTSTQLSARSMRLGRRRRARWPPRCVGL